MKEIFTNDQANLTASSEGKLVILHWKSQPDNKAYREVFYKVLEFIQLNQSNCFISDLSNAGIVDPENRKWLEQEIIPKALQAGLKRIATVMEKNVFKQYYVNHVSTELTKGGATLKVFGSLEEAKEWMNQADILSA